ncbi:MAG: hypothetical protein ACT4NY_27275 [Pseudonocardiales bacterium]
MSNLIMWVTRFEYGTATPPGGLRPMTDLYYTGIALNSAVGVAGLVAHGMDLACEVARFADLDSGHDEERTGGP